MDALQSNPLAADQRTITSMPLRDACLLALKNWPWLIFAPMAVMIVVSLTYINLPTRHSAIAVLNVDMKLLLLSAQPVIDNLDPSATIQLNKNGSGAVIVTADAMEKNRALDAVQAVVDSAPQADPFPSSLTSEQTLELRALRQYQSSLLAEMTESGLDSLMIGEEIAKVKKRLSYLDLIDVPVEALPKVAQEARVIPVRRPPTRNVAAFSFLFTLFVTWMFIYSAERRHIVRQGGV